ncbi:MAG: hypothetical protein ACOCNX_08275, partial [Prevotella sp.]
ESGLRLCTGYNDANPKAQYQFQKQNLESRKNSITQYARDCRDNNYSDVRSVFHRLAFLLADNEERWSENG